MMIDHVVFFITLNPISVWSNLTNDGLLLAVVEFKASLFHPTGGPADSPPIAYKKMFYVNFK